MFSERQPDEIHAPRQRPSTDTPILVFTPTMSFPASPTSPDRFNTWSATDPGKNARSVNKTNSDDGGGGNLTIEPAVFGQLDQVNLVMLQCLVEPSRLARPMRGPRHPDDREAAYNMKRTSPAAISGLGSPEMK
ncbi:hypothetical protein ASPFODRAFT_210102 [Aspergillus luchuensis CBS 106.47]|uniref:Uncharacterized protein n=1 Tax=Aspergillus luchuensis (strain CBS 106.47) TaxID=1137211 RepID=A0A1M3T957_ASPLC|nr:hypothetical protein ASPFODRAFT_210102 [Aspergillus luchuensis CBS 106.47]